MLQLHTTTSELSYSITKKEAIKQLGKKAYKRLVALQQWLYGMRRDLTFRPAPCIIARSEAELFGISSPRFALRTSFAQNSFVNARRLATFVHNAAVACEANPVPDGAAPVTRSDLRHEILGVGQCVADSLLKLPKRLRTNKYQALECELGRAYGEGEAGQATPFLQHTTLGGGMCAQAACFMVLALYERFVNSIFGIAEITALAREGDGPELDLSGMHRQSIVDFFNNPRVGLHACEEIQRCSRDLVAVAMHSYLMSKVPLILPVDFGRMRGDLLPPSQVSLLKKNRTPFARRQSRFFTRKTVTKQNHTVVVIGCHESDNQRYLLNDPATYPFLEATLDDIYAILPYHNAIPEPLQENSDRAHLGFISITPAEVRLPLLTSVDQEGHLRSGLLSRAVIAQESSEDASLNLPFDNPCSIHPGYFRLVHFGGASADVFAQLDCLPRKAADSLIQEVAQCPFSNVWQWVQYLPANVRPYGSIWLWNAQIEPSPSPSEYLPYLTALYYIDPKTYAVTRHWPKSWLPTGQNLTITRPNCDARDTQQLPVTSTRPTAGNPGSLSLSLISSFSTEGASCTNPVHLGPYNAQHYPTVDAETGRSKTEMLPAEVYLFMEPEMKQWLDEFGRRLPWNRRSLTWRWKAPINAVEFLARLNGYETERIAAQLAHNFPVSRSAIVALASFVPEITRPAGSGQGDLAVAAVQRLIEFARELQRNGHPTRFVELVAGSAIQGIRRRCSGKASHPQFYASFLQQQEARTRLLSTLRRALRQIPRDDTAVYVALELEPGPCFVLRDWSSIRELAQMLDDDEDLCDRVGFNLDIGHWRIAQVREEMVRHCPVVLSKIAHAHISGHHRCAHFGDAPILNLNQTGVDLNCKEDFLPWLNLLRTIAAERESLHQNAQKYPDFSGFISLELEVCKNGQLVIQSARELLELLKLRDG